MRSRSAGWWLWAGPVVWFLPGLFWVTGVITALTLHHRGRPSPAQMHWNSPTWLTIANSAHALVATG